MKIDPKSCELPGCDKPIPNSRKSSAKYCCDACYYAAKKARSRLNYLSIKEPFNRIRRFENILADFHKVIKFDKQVTMDDLRKAGFDFGFSNTEKKHDGKIYKIIGRFAYYIDPKSKIVEIHELRIH